MRLILPGLFAFTIIILLSLFSARAWAGQTATAGPYHLQVSTDPAVVPVGRATLIVKITDGSGSPVDGAKVRALVEMPGMKMGEREESGVPQPGQPGTYRVPAQFPMGGGYNATIVVKAAAGEGRAVVSLSTGENTGDGSGGFPWVWIGTGLALLVGVFAVVGLRRARIDWHAVRSGPVVGGIVLITVMLALSYYAVQHFRRPGSMTPIEGQSMEMDMPAPPGTMPVVLAMVQRGSVDNVVRVSGQAVGFVEQDVYPRVPGVIIEMSVYVGDHVQRGQVLARLDTSQIEPQVNERRAAVTTAEQQYLAAVADTQQAREQVREAQGELGIQHGGVDEARAEIGAAEQARASAAAQVTAARADQIYAENQVKRSKTLYDNGALSLEEYQKDRDMAANAYAKLRAAQAERRRADAMISQSNARLEKAQSQLMAHHAHVTSMQAAERSSQQKVSAAQAVVQQSRASLAATTTQQGYAEIRAAVDGVVTQRLISPGVLVSPGQAILRVAQVRPIRLQANVAAVDLASIHVGSDVTIRARNDAETVVHTRVSSVQPAVDPTSRTGVVEAVVPNTGDRFMPGAYVEMAITTTRVKAALNVPAAAVNDGGTADGRPRSFVWRATPVEGRNDAFTVHAVDVQVLLSDGQRTAVRGDLKEGDRVVAGGGQDLKEGNTVSAAGVQSVPTAALSATPPTAAASATAASGAAGGSPEVVHVDVTEQGYVPDSITLRQGVPAHIVFTRRTDNTCGTEVVLPDYNLRRSLPLNQPVDVEFTPTKTGQFSFTCGMNMLHGKLVVR